MKTLKRMWFGRLRRLDIEILWPSCLKAAPNLDSAKAAFAHHAFHDPAWLCLDESEIYWIIDGLGSDR